MLVVKSDSAAGAACDTPGKSVTECRPSLSTTSRSQESTGAPPCRHPWASTEWPLPLLRQLRCGDLSRERPERSLLGSPTAGAEGCSKQARRTSAEPTAPAPGDRAPEHMRAGGPVGQHARQEAPKRSVGTRPSSRKRALNVPSTTSNRPGRLARSWTRNESALARETGLSVRSVGGSSVLVSGRQSSGVSRGSYHTSW